jgi:Xaa-Pro aminopeptidase
MQRQLVPALQRYWQDRRGRLQKLLAEAHVDGLFIVDRHVLTWLGFNQVEEALVTVDSVILEPSKKNVQEFRKGGTFGFDSRLSASRLLSLQHYLPQVRWQSLGEEISRLFMTKDGAELVLLREAARITRCIFARLEAEIDEGQACTELDLLYSAHETLLSQGGSEFAFDPSIAVAERSTFAWAGVTTRQLRHGETLIVDLGASFHGYQCDMARSYQVGRMHAAVKSEWSTASHTVREAFMQICEQVRPGVSGAALHAQCEQILGRSGFSMPYILGHGVGQLVHEPPYLAPGSRDVLQAGMIIAIEPAVILGKEMAVRYEDIGVVTEDGYELLGQLKSSERG